MMHKTTYALVAAAVSLALLMPVARAQTPGAAQPSEEASARSSQPMHTYRLTFTVTETDSGKRIGVQHFAMTAVPNQRASMKQGSKIPVMTGDIQDAQSPKTSTVQFTYIDVGLNCTAFLTERPDGVEAAIKLERSSVAETPSTLGGVQEPVIRQAVLENTAILKPGTPVMIGSLDVPDSTRRLDIEVTMDRVP